MAAVTTLPVPLNSHPDEFPSSAIEEEACVTSKTLDIIHERRKGGDTMLFNEFFEVRMCGVDYSTFLVGIGFQGGVFGLVDEFPGAKGRSGVVKVFKERATAMLEHHIIGRLAACPHVVDVLSICSDGPCSCIVMEDAGACLYDVRHTILDEAAVVCSQMLIGLRHMHEQHVAWRDVKLDNMLWNKQTRCVKFCDMGFAHVMTPEERETRTLTTFCGSLSYAAPEIMKKQPFNGKEVDAWSVIVTIIAFLFGLLPFHRASKECPMFRNFVDSMERGDTTPYEWLERRVVGSIEDVADVSVRTEDVAAWLPHIVNGLMVVDPSKRRSISRATVSCE